MQELEKILEEMEQYRRRAVENGDFNVAAAHEKDMNIISKHMNDGWIPVEEPPEDGQTVLCTDGEYVYLVEYDADLDAPFGDVDNITDWQPSPEPRRRKRREGE